MGVKIINGKIQDLHFTINLNYLCNLSCEYCPLINQNKHINYEVLDYYISFILKNEKEIYKNCINMVFIFFGGEPLIDFDKIIYFLDKVGFKNKKYVIYTNGLLINENIIKKLKKYKNKKIIFYISIDGEYNLMKKNRGFTKKQFNKLINNISLLKKYYFDFSITKVIRRTEKSFELYNSLLFLDSLNPVKLDFLPEAFSDIKVDFNIKKQYIQGLELFIEYIKNKKAIGELEIMEYLGLPDEYIEFINIYQVDFGLYLDVNGSIYGITDALKSFNIDKTFNIDEGKSFKLCNFKEEKKLLDIIKNYKKYEENITKKILLWYKREFPEDVKISRIMGLYFIKKLLMYKYKPQN